MLRCARRWCWWRGRPPRLLDHRARLIASALLSYSPAAAESPDANAAIAQALLESAPVAIYHAGDGGATPYVNPEYRSVFGITAEKSVDDWAQALHPADRARVEETWNDFSRNPRPMKFEYRVQSATGQVRYFREQLVRAARIAGFVGTISDFTDLVTARGNLHRAETLFHDTFDQAPSVLRMQTAAVISCAAIPPSAPCSASPPAISPPRASGS